MAAAAPRAFALILASLLLAGYTADPQEESGTGPGGRESAGTTYEHATGPDDVVVSVMGRMLDDGAEGLGFGLNTTAAFVLLGHGTAIVPGVFDFAPVDGIDPVYPEIVPAQSVTVPEDKIQRLLELAADLGLLAGDIDYGHLGETALPLYRCDDHGGRHRVYAICGRLGPRLPHDDSQRCADRRAYTGCARDADD